MLDKKPLTRDLSLPITKIVMDEVSFSSDQG